MNYSKEKFVDDSLELERIQERFEVIKKRLVWLELDGRVWIKSGSAIAHRGDLTFRRERIFQVEAVEKVTGPLRGGLKRDLVPMTKAEGQGYLYISDQGKYGQVVRLEGDSLYVVATSLLAFEPSLAHEARLLGGVGVLAGGLCAVKLTGSGLVALGVRGDPLTLRVMPDAPLYTTPMATIAWSGGLWPDLKTDLELRSLLKRGGGEEIQMSFGGDGYVVVQGREETIKRGNLSKRISGWVKDLLGL